MSKNTDETPLPQTLGDRLPADAEIIDGLICVGDEAYTPAEWVLEHPSTKRMRSPGEREEARRLSNRMAQRRFQQKRQLISVERVIVDQPSGMGIGIGTTQRGTTEVIFAGDADALAALGRVLDSGAPVDIPGVDWTIVRRRKRDP